MTTTDVLRHGPVSLGQNGPGETPALRRLLTAGTARDPASGDGQLSRSRLGGWAAMSEPAPSHAVTCLHVAGAPVIGGSIWKRHCPSRSRCSNHLSLRSSPRQPSKYVAPMALTANPGGGAWGPGRCRAAPKPCGLQRAGQSGPRSGAITPPSGQRSKCTVRLSPGSRSLGAEWGRERLPLPAALCSGGPHGPAPYTAWARGPGHIAGHGESLQRPPRAGIASTFFHTVNAGSVPWAMQTWGAGSLPVNALPGHCGIMGSITADAESTRVTITDIPGHGPGARGRDHPAMPGKGHSPATWDCDIWRDG